MSMFSDFHEFHRSGQLLLSGQYSSLYPLPAVALFAALSLLPEPVSLALLLSVSAILLVIMFKRAALAWIFFVPVLESFALGQWTIIALWLLRKATPWSLALLTFKPHLALLAIPALVDRPELRKPFVAWCALLYVPSFLLRPTWPVEWLPQIFGDGRVQHNTSASLWSAPALIPMALVGMLALRRVEWKAVLSALNPAFRPYDYTLLAGMHWALLPASWLALIGMHLVGAAWPMALVGVAAGLTVGAARHTFRNPLHLRQPASFVVRCHSESEGESMTTETHYCATCGCDRSCKIDIQVLPRSTLRLITCLTCWMTWSEPA